MKLEKCGISVVVLIFVCVMGNAQLRPERDKEIYVEIGGIRMEVNLMHGEGAKLIADELRRAEEIRIPVKKKGKAYVGKLPFPVKMEPPSKPENGNFERSGQPGFQNDNRKAEPERGREKRNSLRENENTPTAMLFISDSGEISFSFEEIKKMRKKSMPDREEYSRKEDGKKRKMQPPKRVEKMPVGCSYVDVSMLEDMGTEEVMVLFCKK